MTHATATIHPEPYATSIEVDGHRLTADKPENRGGGNKGPAPYDLLLASLGACTTITLRMYADRKAWPMEALEIGLRLIGMRADMRIERTLTITGLDDAQKARLAEIAERTPVTLTLKSGLLIHTTLT
jgi:putative redox protein